ncbi:MAG: ABC transporter permease [Thermoplasmata archaeon]
MNLHLKLNVRALLGRAYPRIIGAQREPSWVFFEIFLPVLSIAAYVFIYYALKAPPEFVGFVILGGAMTAFWLNVLWSMAAQLYWEKEIGNLQLYMMAPMSRMSLLGGMAVGGIFMSSTRAVATIVVGVILFKGVSPVFPLMLIPVFLVTLVALYGMGMMFASLYLMWGREAWHMASLMEEPIYLLSGFYFPVKALGFWVAISASVIPITLGLDSMRQLLFPTTVARGWHLLPVEVELAILVVLAIVFIILAKFALTGMENLARKKGGLTLRWQ